MSIEEKIYATVAEHIGISVRDVSMEKRIVEDLGADSLDSIELCIAVEEMFDIVISDEIWDTVKTVADIVQIVVDEK